MEHFSADITGVAPVLYVQRRVLHTLSATCVWCRLAFLASSAQICIQRNGPRVCCNTSKHVVAVWSDIGAGLDVTGLHPNLRHCWWWVADESTPEFCAAYPDGSVCAVSVLCQGRPVHLFTSAWAVDDIDELQCFRLRLTLSEYGTCFLPRLEKPRRTATCSALTRQMQFALDDKNLGKWAMLQQCRVPWLPYDRHKGLREARRLSYVPSWYVGVTPPSHLVYVVFHLYLSVVYVGQTHLAPVQRLRKHLTDAAAGSDNSTLHRLMATTDSAHWGIGVLQYVGDTWWTAVRERAWWWQLSVGCERHTTGRAGSNSRGNQFRPGMDEPKGATRVA